MDKRKHNGGHSTAGKAGRKSKADELKIIESLDLNIDPDKAFKKLGKLIDDENLQAIRLYLSYRYGRPKEIQAEHDSDDKYIFKPIDRDIVDDDKRKNNIPVIKWVE